MKRNRTAPIHFSPRDAIGTTSGTPTGTRAAGTSAPTTPRATSANARHIRTRTPRPHTHAMRAPMVGRDVLGAPRPRDDIGDAHMYAGRRGRRPLPRSAPRPHTHIARRTRTPCAHLVGRDVLGAPLPTRTPSGTPTGARAAGDVGPYHAPRHVRQRTPRPHTHATSAHARHARTWSGATSSARRCPRERHRGRPRARGPPGTSAPTMHRAMSANARHVRTRTPRPHTHAMRAPGPARRPRRAVAHENAIGDAHGRAGRRGRRPLPCTAPCPPTHATSAHARHVRTRTPCAHLVRRDVLGAPLSTERHQGRPRARGPPGTSAPTTHRAMSAHAHRAPHTHAMRAPGRARRPRRAAPTGRPRNDIGDAHGHAGRRDVGPYHALRHVRTRTSRAAHARHVRTRTARAYLVSGSRP